MNYEKVRRICITSKPGEYTGEGTEGKGGGKEGWRGTLRERKNAGGKSKTEELKGKEEVRGRAGERREEKEKERENEERRTEN